MNYMEKEGGEIVLSDLSDFTSTMPFFGPRRVLYLKDTGLFKAAGGEDFEKWIASIPDTATVIFSESEVDKRKALFKAVQANGAVYGFDPPTEQLLSAFVLQKVKTEHKNITKDAYNYLMENLELDYLVADNELEKLFSFTMDKNDIQLSDVKEVITESFETQVYTLTDFVTKGQREEAMNIYMELLTSQKADPFAMISMMGKEFLRFLVTKEMTAKNEPDDAIVKALTLNPKILWKYKKESQRIRQNTLEEALRICADFEESAKNGNLMPKYACELLIFKLTDLMNGKRGK